MFSPVIAIFGLGPEEMILIVLLLVVLFGATKIPQLARSLGRAKGEFQKGAQESREELAKGGDAPATAAEDEKVLKAAKELGIPTEGRPISDVKADLKKRLA